MTLTWHRWLALLSGLLAISRSFDGLNGEAERHHVLNIQPDALLQSVAAHTHYMPAHWRGRGHTRAVYAEFRSLYVYRVLALAQVRAPPLPLLIRRCQLCRRRCRRW